MGAQQDGDLGGSGGLRLIEPEPEDPADRVDEIGAVEGIEVEGIDAFAAQRIDLFGSHHRGDEIAGLGVFIEALETCRQCACNVVALAR